MTTATLNELADHHAAQSLMYASWADLAEEDDAPRKEREKVEAYRELAADHGRWAEECRNLATSFVRAFTPHALNPSHARHHA